MLKALVQAHQQQPNTRNRRIAGMLGGILQGWDAGRFSAADADILFSDMIELAALLKRAGYSSKSFGAKTIPCLQARGQALLAKGRMFSETVMAAMRELGVA